ncbi:hypothetical protein PUNSTDRAFT_142897 [Punctularia strigosozonata HHB-11173 SS5]|uniref:uncharacterized protein n=1 Tax=Punctularia strigosozonata (strain HHB-11173) TaxID=741275 RepID=UPI000441692C|nr:uncharacterized protein PUNSTDRAFT_142897 [Punctularia strigosozonata HHB-11173 SS5]EIN11034.1 hypothetical protein PUNSTDRAFT_142897 [Punctularia strigosozonata HHB-11173 SS5]
MVEYVYALHDFQPEHEDELPFRAGERIEVIEKDDMYGDGWWQGRNLSGRLGLFPQSYTTPAAPLAQTEPTPAPSSTVEPSPAEQAAAAATVHLNNSSIRQVGTQLHPVDEEPEPPSATTVDANPTASPSPSPYSQPSASPFSQPTTSPFSQPSPSANDAYDGYADSEASQSRPWLHGEADDTSPVEQNGRVMRETMTDVQKAIEQLGRGHGPMDSRSFSFASSREDYTDRGSETEGSEFDPDAETEGDDEGTGWHKEARQKLAEKARKAALRKERESRTMSVAVRMISPPIDVEMSDESEEEDEGHTAHHRLNLVESPSDGRPFGHQRSHSVIAEESGEDEGQSATVLPKNEGTPEPTATATQTTFPTIYPPPQASAPVQKRLSAIYPEVEQLGGHSSETFTTATPGNSIPTPVTPVSGPSEVAQEAAPPAKAEEMQKPSSPPVEPAPPVTMPTPLPSVSSVSRDFAMGLPSPAASAASNRLQQQQQTIAPMPTLKTGPSELAPPTDTVKSPTSHPSEWTVEEVVEWLKSKGFDQSVCDKFVEQEITGDVLLELTVEVLKMEIGIAQFGKRVRIANAIADLRRPPSVSSDPDTTLAPSQSHSIADSGLSPSSGTFAQTPVSLGRYSVQSSSHSAGNRSARSIVSPESPGQSTDMTLGGSPVVVDRQGHARKESDLGSGHSIRWITDTERNRDSDQLLAVNGRTKGRPTQLSLSPSDSALGAKAVAHQNIPEERGEDEHGVASETEAHQTEKSKRRRFFGRSAESTLSAVDDRPSSKRNSADANGGSIRDSATEVDSVHSMSRHGKKKSFDGTPKSHDRLSIFGSPFSGGLGKTRKPAPRYSVAMDNADLPSEKSSRSLSRLVGSKRGSGRPGTSDGSPANSPTKTKEGAGEMGEKTEKPLKPLSPSAVADIKPKDPALLRKRTSSAAEVPRVKKEDGGNLGALKSGQNILEQIGTPDHYGWMRKRGDRYNSWKLRYFVLKGPHLYILRSNSKTETKIKGYINIQGYKVIADENVDPGRYGFRIEHDTDKTHYFSSEEQLVIREWMKSFMKATISRDYNKPVVSSVNIPTIPLAVAQTMNPAPRPPSPTARDATQKALRRENTNQLSSRDARVLMGLPSETADVDPVPERTRLESVFTSPSIPVTAKAEGESSSRKSSTSLRQTPSVPSTPRAAAPPRPSREMRRISSTQSEITVASGIDSDLIIWANSHLPRALKITGTTEPLCGGLTLLRLAEHIKGRPASPPVLDSAFPSGPNDDKLDGLFRLFDFLLDNDVKMGSVSINDVRQGKRDKLIQLLKALRAWEDKKKALAASLEKIPTMQQGPIVLW